MIFFFNIHTEFLEIDDNLISLFIIKFFYKKKW